MMARKTSAAAKPSSSKGSRSRSTKPARTFDALPDTVDFRDVLYAPALIVVRPATDIAEYRRHKVPVLDQGQEGACTGYGLATVVNYLMRVRGKQTKADAASAWMLYTMAKRYDEWKGEKYEGSSARGAMKGWHKHGVCAMRLWEDGRDNELAGERSVDALNRPLGAYFRVNHRDLVAMHAAINEVGILYATATVHDGWQSPKGGVIPYTTKQLGGHAFAIVGYDRQGFYIQNSWGTDWGDRGIARLSYEDWLANGTDVWVAALGAAIDIAHTGAPAGMRAGAPRSYESEVYANLRPHIIVAGNDGVLEDKGDYGLTDEGLRSILRDTLPLAVKGWANKRVLVHAHGGLVSMGTAIDYVAKYKGIVVDNEVYPLAFIWQTDFFTTFRNILAEAIRGRRDEGFLGDALDFMLDRLDDTLEPIVRRLGGKAAWDEMKENAELATLRRDGKGAARKAADHLTALRKAGTIDEIHLVGHSAGAIFLAPLAEHLAGAGVTIDSLSLWAPACTMKLFDKSYRPLIDAGKIAAFDLYTMDDATEQADDCANIYHKSLLYLVSNAFEEQVHFGPQQQGEPLLGLYRDVSQTLTQYMEGSGPTREWIVSPTNGVSTANHHGDFNDDTPTLLHTLRRVIGGQPVLPAKPSATALPAKTSLSARRVRAKIDVALAGVRA
jgi:hypothetical protein